MTFRPVPFAILAFALFSLACGGGGGPTGTPAATVAPPVPAFTFEPESPRTGTPVTFTDTSSNTPTGWNWSFGDGATSTQAHPTHAFPAGTYTVTLTATNAGGSAQISRSLTVLPPGPVAAFSFTPAAPIAGTVVTFADASTGAPATWDWDFGDGTTSTAHSPLHIFASAGTFPVTLTVASAGGSNRLTRTVTVAPATPAAGFEGSLLLGSPTASSVRAKVFSATQSGTVSLQFGVGTPSQMGPAVPLSAGAPAELVLTGLAPDTRYTTQLRFTPAGGGPAILGPTGAFHTARPAGQAFTFTIQADSHMDENSDRATYLRALGNVLADAPDFHVDLGDTFMCEKHGEPFSATSPPAASAAVVEARYRFERENFSTLGSAVPLFLVNGNHEGEAGWAANGSAQSLSVWTAQARQRHFANPVPDGFYSGDPVEEPYIGKRAAWYAWTWGDAHFIVLDPFWNTPSQPGRDPWLMSLGDRQYQWLVSTLAASKATFKFIFIHNLVGGLDGQMRGGIEAAPYFEWGGKALDGSNVFAQKRPTWGQPLHALFVANKVTAVFHGHDHLYCKQELDGIVYQEVPQPSAVNFQSGPVLAKEYHYASGTILSSSGHLRVTVSPDKVTTQYIRTWLPSQETATRRNGQVEDTWSVVKQP